MKVSVIIPALNEEKNLPAVLRRIPQIPEICEVILVDGHSTDHTVKVAREAMPRIKIVSQDNSGKGDAISCGARASTGDYFLVIDADGSQQPEEILLYVSKAKEGYDLVKGSRFMRGGYSDENAWHRRLTTGAAQFVANTLWRTRFTDICYGMFLVNRDRYMDLGICAQRHDVEWEMIIKAYRRGLKIVEVPSFEAKRAFGRSHLSYVKDGWLIAVTILREFIRGIFYSGSR